MDKSEKEILIQENEVYKDLDILAKSKGGKVLTKTLIKDVVGIIDTLASKFDVMTHQEFMSYSAQMKEKLNIVRVLHRAEGNKDFLTEEIKKLLEEEIEG